MFHHDTASAEHGAANTRRAQSQGNAAQILAAAMPEDRRQLAVAIVGGDLVAGIALHAAHGSLDETP
jgi:hypothetical protein